MVERVLSEKQRDWLAHIEACSEAGISMKVYAERHGLDLHQFYLWKGRLRKLGQVPGRPGPKQKLFKEVRVAEPAKITGKTCIQFANGVNIEAPGDVDTDALAALLKLAMRLS